MSEYHEISFRRRSNGIEDAKTAIGGFVAGNNINVDIVLLSLSSSPYFIESSPTSLPISIVAIVANMDRVVIIGAGL